MCRCSDPCGLADSGGTGLPRVSRVPDMVIRLLTGTPFGCRPANPGPSTTSFVRSHTLGHSSPFPVTPGPGTRPLGTQPVPQSQLELFTSANSQSTYPVSLHSSSFSKKPHGSCHPHSLSHSLASASQLALLPSHKPPPL